MLKRPGLKLLLVVFLLIISLPLFAATTIPSQAWSRDINGAGYKDGASIGGFGAGTVTWRLNGNFYKTRLNIGAGSDDGSAFADDANCKFFLYQKLASGSATTTQLDAATLGSGQATYYSLFPKSWVNYTGSQFTVKAVVTQFSPIIPNDLTKTSYPVGIYEWDLSNPTAGNVDAAIMMTWDNNDFSGVSAQYVTAGNFSGIVLGSGVANPPNCNQGEFCLGTTTGTGITATYMSAAAIATLKTAFSTAGQLSNTVGSNTVGGVAFKVTLTPGQSMKIPIVLSWDIPVFQIGGNGSTGKKWYREYTRHWSRTGQNSWAIAQDALANYASYESQIDSWQNGVLTNVNYPDWLKTMLFNELYIYFNGGTAWEAGAASGQTDNPNEDMFSHLESYIYLFYGTSDVSFYGSWALFLNWPDLDKQVIRQFSDSVVLNPGAIGRPAAIGTTAHDLGGLQAGPIQCANGSTIGNYYLFDMWNCYQYRASCTWKDLNSKLVLMIYRDFHLTGDSDMNFLNYCWNSVKAAMNMVHSQCTANNLPQSSGVDQTYDDMGLTGSTAYCGSLYLAACQAAQQMALAEGDAASAATYQSWLTAGQASFESLLWTGTYYKIDTGSSAPTRIMSDQLCGQWYSKALGLGGVVSDAHAQSAWQTVHDNNWSKFDAGAHGVVNVMTAAGAIDGTSSQTAECWVGTSWGAVSGMVEEGMTTQANDIGQSLYNTIWNTGQYWFRTPEAWQTGLTSTRAYYYMRGSTIWAAKRAYDILMPVATATNTPNYTHTITPTNTPYYSPTITATITPTATVNPCITSYRRVNCGGPAATDSIGRAWSADQAYTAGGWGSVGATNETAVGNAIANTNDDVLYQTGAWGGTIGYSFTVPNGPWRVVLRFAEINFNAPNSRKFSVFIEGQQVLTDLDIFVAAGNARYAAVDYTFDTTVSDGILNITTTSTIDAAKFSAIEIIDLSTQCSPTVTPTTIPGTATRTPTYTQTRTSTSTCTNTPYYSPTNTQTNTPYYSPTYTRTRTVTPTFTSTPVFAGLRVDCAGPQYTDGSGNVWLADQAYTAGSWGYTTAGTPNTVADAIAGTTDDILYDNERWNNGTLSYAFDMPNGTYEVTLKFAELWYGVAGRGTGGAGMRQFNIVLEGTQVMTNLDIYAVHNSADYAVDEVFDVTVVDGQLNIDLTKGSADNPTIEAIQILRFVPTPTNTPSGTRTCTPTSSPTYSATASRTSTMTPSSSPSFTPTYTNTPTPTRTPTPTASPTGTDTASATYTYTKTGTPTPTVTATPTNTITVTSSSSPTITITWTGTPPTPTNTPTATTTSSRSATPTLTGTPTGTSTDSPTSTCTATATPTNSFTATPTGTLSATPTFTPTATVSETMTMTATPTYTVTATPSISPTYSVTPSITMTVTGTPPTPTYTTTATDTYTATATGTDTMSFTPTATPSGTATKTPSPSSSPTLTATVLIPSETITQTFTGTPTPAISSPTPTATGIINAPTPFTPDISEPLAFPNPCNDYQPVNIRFDISRDCSNISFKLYSEAFRLIMKTDSGPRARGTVTIQVQPESIKTLANGTYYYLISGRDAVLGVETRAKAGELIVIK